MKLIELLKSIFQKKRIILCGGTGLCEVVNRGNVVARIWYRRPTSDEVLQYTYDLKYSLGSESQLKELESEKNNKDRARKCHEIMLRDLSIPYAEKIFERAEGFVNEQLLDIKEMSKVEQFEFLKKYRSHNLIELTVQAFNVEGTLKKKD